MSDTSQVLHEDKQRKYYSIVDALFSNGIDVCDNTLTRFKLKRFDWMMLMGP